MRSKKTTRTYTKARWRSLASPNETNKLSKILWSILVILTLLQASKCNSLIEGTPCNPENLNNCGNYAHMSCLPNSNPDSESTSSPSTLRLMSIYIDNPRILGTLNYTCQHKHLFPLSKITAGDIVGLLLILILSMFSTAAGVGGGAVMVPLCLLTLRFSVT